MERQQGTRQYRVKEVFRTVQGEGYWAGTDSVFIRLVGCNMWSGYEKDRQRDHDRTGASCPLWCDTDFRKEGSEAYWPSDLARRARDVAGGSTRLVVITGGEPLLVMRRDLVLALHNVGFNVAVETNGTVEAQCEPDWVTVSPKLPDAATKVRWANEVKFVLPDYHPAKYPTLLERVVPTCGPWGVHHRHVWIQPCDGHPKMDREDVHNLCLRTIMDGYGRLSLQQHKYVGAP